MEVVYHQNGSARIRSSGKDKRISIRCLRVGLAAATRSEGRILVRDEED
jgi:hypothetical protein